MTPPLLCTHPFNWLEIHGDGSVFVCCPAWLRRPVGNLLQQSLQEIWHGERIVELRKSTTNGSFHHCSPKRCPFLAQALAPNRSIDDHGNPVTTWDEITDPRLRQAIEKHQFRPDFGPTILNLCYDPRCNLACPSCRTELVQLTEPEQQRVEELTQRIVDQLAPHVRQLRLSGHGDPFAAPGYRNLLQTVSRQSFPALQTIHLHTNGLLWTPATWHKMAHLHPYVRSAEISIDAATPDTYRLNRGADFNRLLQNLGFIQSLGLDLLLSFVVQHNNFREMPGFVALANRFGARCYFSPLINWGSWSQEAYQQRAVHRPQHAEHGELLELLHELNGRDGVNLGSLRALTRG
ncbi:MAG: SPASM domain-containing protein [Desulfuromonadaceae bacterium]|nr:SPASM domain-containing protein [Desulfuromonadaceae bacterium]